MNQTLKQDSKIWKSEGEKNGEVKCTYNLFINAKKSEESTRQFIENLSIITRVACKASVSPKNDEKMCFLAQTSVYCSAETKVTLNN